IALETDWAFGSVVAIGETYMVASAKHGLYVSALSDDGEWGSAMAVSAPQEAVADDVTDYEDGLPLVVVFSTNIPEWWTEGNVAMAQRLTSPVHSSDTIQSYGVSISLPYCNEGQRPAFLAVGEPSKTVMGMEEGGLVHIYTADVGFYQYHTSLSQAPVTTGAHFGWKVSMGALAVAVAGGYGSDTYVTLYKMDPNVGAFIPVLDKWTGSVSSLALPPSGDEVYIGAPTSTEEGTHKEGEGEREISREGVGKDLDGGFHGGVLPLSQLYVYIDTFVRPVEGTFQCCQPLGAPMSFFVKDAYGGFISEDMSDKLKVYWDIDTDHLYPQPITHIEGVYGDGTPVIGKYDVDVTSPAEIGSQGITVYLDGLPAAKAYNTVYSYTCPSLSTVEGGGVEGESFPLSVTLVDGCGTPRTSDTSQALVVVVSDKDTDTEVFSDIAYDYGTGVYVTTVTPLEEGVYTAAVYTEGEKVSSDIYICQQTVSDSVHLSNQSALAVPTIVTVGDKVTATLSLVTLETGPTVSVSPVRIDIDTASYTMHAEGELYTADVVFNEIGSASVSVFVAGSDTPLISTHIEVDGIPPETGISISAIVGWCLLVILGIYTVVRELALARVRRKRYSMLANGLAKKM
ncbi:hypothetical protein KIPB_005850, partial [Kipferlia bialata]